MVLHYPRLVRLAYMALPGEGERHHRALTAHGIVQNTLPRDGVLPGLQAVASKLPIPLLPRPRRRARLVGRASGAASDAAYAALRLAVLREVLWAPRRRWPGFLAVVLRPRVWGLRLFPIGGGAEELRLAAALRDAEPVARAAYVLITLEGLTPRQAEALLNAAGAEDCRAAVAAGHGWPWSTRPRWPRPASSTPAPCAPGRWTCRGAAAGSGWRPCWPAVPSRWPGSGWRPWWPGSAAPRRRSR
jgi:hypothetical protein